MTHSFKKHHTEEQRLNEKIKKDTYEVLIKHWAAIIGQPRTKHVEIIKLNKSDSLIHSETNKQ